MNFFARWFAVVMAVSLATAVAAQSLDLPTRQGKRPQTTNSVPHVQIGIEANPELSDELLRRVEKFPGVTLGATFLSLPGAVGFQIERDMPLARPEAIVGGREFAHLHPDGSLHASLDPDIAAAAVEAGWAVMHPWSSQREGWEGFVMIYTPQTRDENEVVYRLVQSSYAYVSGRMPPE